MPFKKPRSSLSFLLIIFASTLLLYRPAISAQNIVHFIELNDDTINPVTAEYIVNAIDKATQEKAQCLIIKLDTPGGLLNSTRLIVKKMLTAEVPIIVYISPSGSRAGSAGVFITYASHIAAMAPSTNIGAAHPVQMGGSKPKQAGDWEELKDLINDLKKQKSVQESNKRTKKKSKIIENEETEQTGTADDDPMSSKILNDTVAFIKSIAKERNRNVDWGVKSVVESASITADEALEMNVVELIADSDEDLLLKLDGRTLEIGGQEITLQTKDATSLRTSMDIRQRIFNILANPNIAYFLMILGFYGLLYEITHPGIGVPGVLGAIFLILAFYSMQTLPTNYAGLALLSIGLVLLVAEAFVPGFGLLTLGGVLSLVLGSMLLFESADPVMRVSKSIIFTFSGLTAGLTLFLMNRMLKALRSKPLGGKQGLVGENGEAVVNFGKDGRGKIFVHGEYWNATSDDLIKKGDPVVVESVSGLNVKVKLNKQEE